jgi:threonine aldolase
MTVEELVKTMEAQGVRMLPVGPGRIRAVTHYHISSDDIDYALAAFSKVLKKD